MTDATGLGIVIYVLVGLIVAKVAMAGTTLEKKLDDEHAGMIEGRHGGEGVFLFLLCLSVWPLVLAVLFLCSRITTGTRPGGRHESDVDKPE